MKKKLFTIALVLIAGNSLSQYLNYENSGQLLNPAAAGFEYEDQFNYTNSRFTTNNGSISKPMGLLNYSTFSEKRNMGFGINYISMDNWTGSGYGQTVNKSQHFVMLNGNKQFHLGNDRWFSAGLGLGGNIGAYSYYDDQTQKKVRSMDGVFVSSIGGAFRTKRLSLGVSAMGVVDEGQLIGGFSLNGSYAFGDEEGWQIIPQATLSLDFFNASSIGATVSYKSKFSVGGGMSRYFSSNRAYVTAGYVIKDKIKLNYNYGFSVGDQLFKSSQHEISFAFLLGKR